MHNHCHCDHTLKYCEVCDVVYCKGCNREWGGVAKPYWSYLPPHTYPYSYPYTDSPSITWTDANTYNITSSGDSVYNHTHSVATAKEE